MNIRDIVSSALFDAKAEEIEIPGDLGKLHRERSRTFVECLSVRLLELCAEYDSVAALSKHHDDNRRQFGMNELLFDIAVVQYGTVNSGSSDRELAFVSRGIWAVESELARNKREALFDFNKLVLADAENKLFIGPRLSEENDYLRVLGEAARHCSGHVYVSLIPHPDSWADMGGADVVAWEWGTDGWEPVS